MIHIHESERSSSRSELLIGYKQFLLTGSAVYTSMIWGPILEFARGSFPSIFPRLSNETPPTAYSKSHRISPLEISRAKSTSGIYRSTFESRIRDCRDKATLTNRELRKIKGSGTDKISDNIDVWGYVCVMWNSWNNICMVRKIFSINQK